MIEEAAMSTSQRILEAAITCIEKDGLENLTTRRIAEEAGTNIASINYYFRTKDRLVAEALSMTLQHMLDDIYTLIEKPSQRFMDALEEVFFYLIDGGLRFPRIIMAHMYAFLVEKNYDTPAVGAMHKIFERLVERAVNELPGVKEQDIRMALSQVVASVFFITLSPDFFRPVSELDLEQPEMPRRLAGYMTRVFAQNLKMSGRSSPT
jgi:AcrR family transcriptional regulator